MPAIRAQRAHHARQTAQRVVALITIAAAAWTSAAQSYHDYLTGSTQLARPFPPVVSAPAAYRPPLIAIAQPSDGAELSGDAPVVVVRFVAVEPSDPVDALSLRVTVDGVDRTSRFLLAQNEAWGRLSAGSAPLAPGAHEVRARICSVHGACTVASAVVTSGAAIVRE